MKKIIITICFIFSCYSQNSKAFNSNNYLLSKYLKSQAENQIGSAYEMLDESYNENLEYVDYFNSLKYLEKPIASGYFYSETVHHVEGSVFSEKIFLSQYQLLYDSGIRGEPYLRTILIQQRKNKFRITSDQFIKTKNDISNKKIRNQPIPTIDENYANLNGNEDFRRECKIENLRLLDNVPGEIYFDKILSKYISGNLKKLHEIRLAKKIIIIFRSSSNTGINIAIKTTNDELRKIYKIDKSEINRIGNYYFCE